MHYATDITNEVADTSTDFNKYIEIRHCVQNKTFHQPVAADTA